jgi:hypothetical protein
VPTKRYCVESILASHLPALAANSADLRQRMYSQADSAAKAMPIASARKVSRGCFIVGLPWTRTRGGAVESSGSSGYRISWDMYYPQATPGGAPSTPVRPDSVSNVSGTRAEYREKKIGGCICHSRALADQAGRERPDDRRAAVLEIQSLLSVEPAHANRAFGRLGFGEGMFGNVPMVTHRCYYYCYCPGLAGSSNVSWPWQHTPRTGGAASSLRRLERFRR